MFQGDESTKNFKKLRILTIRGLNYIGGAYSIYGFVRRRTAVKIENFFLTIIKINMIKICITSPLK